VTHLRRKMLEELERRNYSEATTRRYLRLVERFGQHFRDRPGAGPGALGRGHHQGQIQLFCRRHVESARPSS
jgi:hypothetical protein